MLKFIALSGTTSVTHNMYVYETDTEMLVVDCGMGFPDLTEKGVDIVLPDYSYVVKNQKKLVGILLSHGHEDHMGALPYLLKEIDAPIWSTKLVAALLREKADNYKFKVPRITVFNEMADEFDIGSFHINSFRSTHSIPETQGFAIDTPEGRIFHVAEHKIDQHPVDGKPFDEGRIKSLAKGSLFLASDSVNAYKKGISPNEQHIEDNLFKIIEKAPQAVFTTAISSNISRFKQFMNVARRTNRKVVFVGYSIMKKCEIAKDLGYLSYDENFVIPPRMARRFNRRELLYIVGGCFGQEGSSLYRLALNEHDKVYTEEGDMVVFSQDPAPPYTKEAQDFLVDNLIDHGVDVHYYALDEDIYVSGHGFQEDIVKLFDLVKPQYIAPVGGTIRAMKLYKDLATGYGIPSENIFRLKPGESIVFEGGNAKRGQSIPVKKVYVDGMGIGDVGRVILEERSTLSSSGVVVCVIKPSKTPGMTDLQLITRGFVFEKISSKLLTDAIRILKNKLNQAERLGSHNIKEIASEFLASYFLSKTGRTPMIIPVIV